MEYSVSDIAHILLSDRPHKPAEIPDTIGNSNVSDIIFDSRSLLDPDSTIFFALKTERDNGHRYIPELYAKGVRTFVVDREFGVPTDFPDAAFIAVDSPAASLRKLAAQHRRRFNIPVIAITGSRGKTMVKEWLHRLLPPTMSVTRSPRSYNSSLGVPISLWQIDDATRLAIIEAGISQSGEMETLRRMIAPQIVVLTDISTAHDEGFPSRADKIAEKLLLAREAEILVYPASDPEIASAVKRAVASGMLRSNIRLIDSTGASTSLTGIPHECTDPQWRRRNLDTCVATMHALGVSDSEIAPRAMHLHPIGTRLNVSDGVNHSLVVADDYTCDIHSLLPALDFLARRATGGRTLTLILSDIGHETQTADATYRAAARLCALRGVTRLVGIGPEISSYAKLFPTGSSFFNSVDEATASLSPSDFDHEMIMVKGTPDSGLDAITHMLESRTHETVLEVNLDALVDNFNFYRSHLKPSTGIVAMVKASGYGAGAYEIAKTLQNRHGAAYLAVAVLDEGIDLRAAGVTMPIMVLNPKVLNYRLLFANRLEPEIYSFDILHEIIAEARKLGVHHYPVHIKLDTGMHRLGFLENDLPKIIDIVRNQDSIRITSVFSHLATADCPDMDDYTMMQLDTFSRWSQTIVDAFPHENVKRHILNTAGIIRFPQYQFDMVRLGIGLYGVPVLNDGSEAPLRQVSTLRTPIIALKHWEAGTTIGYGRRGRLSRHTLVATVPIGYADGINRHMGCGNVSFMVNGVSCPTIGSICMDICMIDVTDVPDVAVGDSVEIFGPSNPVATLSDPLGTIPYEILTSVSPRVPRLYFSE